MKRLLGGANGNRHENDCISLYPRRGVDGKSERQDRNSKDVGRVCDSRRSAKIFEDNPDRTPGIEVK